MVIRFWLRCVQLQAAADLGNERFDVLPGISHWRRCAGPGLFEGQLLTLRN